MRDSIVMKRKFQRVTIIGCAAVSIAAVSPNSLGSSERSIGLAGYVPAVCRAQFQGQPTLIGDDRLALGELRELCNVENGYRVVLSHPSDLRGTLKLGESEIELSETGQTVIVQSLVARERTRSAELVLAGGELPTRLSVRIEIANGTI